MKFHFLKKEDQFALVMFLVLKRRLIKTKSKLTGWWYFFLMLENKPYQQVKGFHRLKAYLIYICSKQRSDYILFG